MTIYAERDGFKLVGGYYDNQLVGYSAGYRLSPGTRWWDGLPSDVSPEFIREDGRRTFVFALLTVHPSWQGRGFGHALHDALLTGRTEERTALLVAPGNEPAHSSYYRWGWKKV